MKAKTGLKIIKHGDTTTEVETTDTLPHLHGILTNAVLLTENTDYFPSTSFRGCSSEISSSPKSAIFKRKSD